MNVFCMILYILNILNLTESDLNLLTFLAAFYYNARIFGLLDDEVLMHKSVNEGNDDSDIEGLVAELMQHYEEEHLARMNG